MGRNKKVIEQSDSVCLYFLPIGDWTKHATCSNQGESWQLCICLWIIELLGQNLMRACLGENIGFQCVFCQQIEIFGENKLKLWAGRGSNKE